MVDMFTFGVLVETARVAAREHRTCNVSRFGLVTKPGKAQCDARVSGLLLAQHACSSRTTCMKWQPSCVGSACFSFWCLGNFKTLALVQQLHEMRVILEAPPKEDLEEQSRASLAKHRRGSTLYACTASGLQSSGCNPTCEHPQNVLPGEAAFEAGVGGLFGVSIRCRTFCPRALGRNIGHRVVDVLGHRLAVGNDPMNIISTVAAGALGLGAAMLGTLSVRCWV